MPIRLCDLLDRAADLPANASSRIHQNVETAIALHNALDRGMRGGAVGNVEDARRHPMRGGEALDAVSIDVRDVDTRARLG